MRGRVEDRGFQAALGELRAKEGEPRGIARQIERQRFIARQIGSDQFGQAQWHVSRLAATRPAK